MDLRGGSSLMTTNENWWFWTLAQRHRTLNLPDSDGFEGKRTGNQSASHVQTFVAQQWYLGQSSYSDRNIRNLWNNWLEVGMQGGMAITLWIYIDEHDEQNELNFILMLKLSWTLWYQDTRDHCWETLLAQLETTSFPLSSFDCTSYLLVLESSEKLTTTSWYRSSEYD